MSDFSEVDALVRLLPALAVVIVLPLLALWWSRNRGGPARQAIRVAAKTPLGKNTWVAVVEADDRRFLIGTGERGVSLISELAEVSTPQDFSDGDPEDGDHDDVADPRMGLIRRLQERTLRRSVTTEGTHVEYTG